MCLMAYLGLAQAHGTGAGGYGGCEPSVLDHGMSRSRSLGQGRGLGGYGKGGRLWWRTVGDGSGSGSGPGSGWVCEDGGERMLEEVEEMNVILFLAWVLPLGLV